MNHAADVIARCFGRAGGELLVGGARVSEVVAQVGTPAFLYDRHSIVRHNRSHPETTRALLEPLSEEPYAMAARLGDPKLVERLNRFLRDFRKDGRYAQIYETHLGEPPDDK